MALRISGLLVAAVTILGLMYRSLSVQVETTSTMTNSTAFDASRTILQDIVGTGGSQFPMLIVVAFVAGGLATVLLIK